MDFSHAIPADFRGCCRIAQRERTLFQAASGCADLPNGIPNTVETRFATASAGKVFVATAILQLVEQGRLRLTDTLGTLVNFDLCAIDPRDHGGAAFDAHLRHPGLFRRERHRRI